MNDGLRQMFGFKEPSHAQAKAIVGLRTAFYNLAEKVLAETASGRDQALAMTKLQEAQWATLAAVVGVGEKAGQS